MPMTEKEFNGNLFDQLAIVERIKRHVVSENLAAAKAEIEIIENEIKRKLYQKQL